ncbi:MAG TPA: PepSY-like domain-containing protein [Isosphaeraceae bacterium]|jgi:hypothetical protein|nr:PepSY-like domain-containing protein [Isosphaeraceae bacterium]
MRSIIVAGAGLVLLAIGSNIHADEQKVALKDVPKVVLDAVKAKFPGAELTGAEKETEDGKTSYEVSLKQGGQNIDVGISAEGKITEIEKEIATKDVPAAVTTAVGAKYPNSMLKKAEEIIKIEGGKETKNYEVIVVTAAKKTIEVVVSPQGKILEEEGKAGEGEDKE